MEIPTDLTVNKFHELHTFRPPIIDEDNDNQKSKPRRPSKRITASIHNHQHNKNSICRSRRSQQHKSVGKCDGEMVERKLSIWENNTTNGLLAKAKVGEQQNQQQKRENEEKIVENEEDEAEGAGGVQLQVAQLLSVPLLPEEGHNPERILALSGITTYDIAPYSNTALLKISLKRIELEFDGQNVQICSESDRCECVWSSREYAKHGQLGTEQTNQFCQMAKLHCALGQAQALELLQKCQYSLQFALIQLEQFAREKQKEKKCAEWTEGETDRFIELMAKHKKDFAKIARKMPERSLAELVERYYVMKLREQCPSAIGTNFVRCPWMKTIREHQEKNITTVHSKNSVPRNKCHNCSRSLWLDPSTVSCDMTTMHWRKRPVLCLPCELYAKFFKMHRPCALPLEIESSRSNSKNENEKQKINQEDRKKEAEEEEKSGGGKSESGENGGGGGGGHDEAKCWLERAFRGGGGGRGHDGHQNPGWTEVEKGTCIAGFRKFGRDFKAIASSLERKSVDDVVDFFLEFQLEYRLDRLISQSVAQQRSS